MLMPSIFGENLFDDWMDFPFEREFFGRRNPLYGKNAKNIMKTDVKETDSTYELDVDLPGFKKENISAQLEDGYLTITANKGLDKDEKDKEASISVRKDTAAAAQEAFMLAKVLLRMRSTQSLKMVS